MEIVSKTEGSKVTMEITGWLDTQTAPQLEKELSALDPGTTSLVFDFCKPGIYLFRRTSSGNRRL